MTSRRPQEIEPVTRSKEQAEASYDRMSRWYDLLAGAFEWRHTSTALEMLGAGPGEEVLEIGFGTGKALVRLAMAVGIRGRVFGIDISGGMLKRAGKRLSRAGLGSGVELVRGDAASLPFGDESVDAVFISFALDLFDTAELPVVLSECLRVLKPGGRLCAVSLSTEGAGRLVPRLYMRSRRVMPSLVDCRPIPAARLIEEAGFEVTQREMASLAGMPVETVLAVKEMEAA